MSVTEGVCVTGGGGVCFIVMRGGGACMHHCYE